MAKETTEKKKTKRPTALKRNETSEKKRLQNRAFKSTVRTVIRDFEDAVEKKDTASTKEKLANVYSIMDKAVKRGIFKINKASRTKARLTARAAAMA